MSRAAKRKTTAGVCVSRGHWPECFARFLRAWGLGVGNISGVLTETCQGFCAGVVSSGSSIGPATADLTVGSQYEVRVSGLSGSVKPSKAQLK